MSHTIRVSDELYEAIDDYRKKDQSFQDVVEEMAEEIGLLPARIQDADDLQNKLENLYGFNSEETIRVLKALRIIYIGQEDEGTIGLPHETIDSEYANEIDALKRLKLVREKHYTGMHDYGYRTTAVGEEIGSELTREILDERESDIESVLDSYKNELLAVLIQFGFNKMDTGHLSDRGAELSGQYVEDIWDIRELLDEYQNFTDQLIDIGIGVNNDPDNRRVVLPPEFYDYLRQRENNSLTEVMKEIEIYQTILNYANNNLESRADLLANLDMATEKGLQAQIREFQQDGLTSRYLEGRDAPFLIKDKEAVEERIAQDMENLLGVAE